MRTAVKSERITILGTPEFKTFLSKEAKKEGVSVSELVRQRCKGKPQSQEQEEVLAAMVEQLQAAVAKANASMDKGLKNAESVLAELHRKRGA
jgi:anti-sigma28 factor (negative regulator of flagellin synthesis)